VCRILQRTFERKEVKLKVKVKVKVKVKQSHYKPKQALRVPGV
jgi:hypothetical protein